MILLAHISFSVWMYYLFPQYTENVLEQVMLFIPCSKTICGLPISQIQHAEPEQVTLVLSLVCLCRVGSHQVKCNINNWLVAPQALVQVDFWGVFQQECFVSIPYSRLLTEMSLQFRKCSLSDSFDICLRFWQPSCWVLLLITDVYLGALGCLSDSCQTNFLWIRIKFGFCYGNKNSQC